MVTFSDKTTKLGTANVHARTGSAVLRASDLSVGSHTITAQFTPQSPAYLASTSQPLIITISSVPVPVDKAALNAAIANADTLSEHGYTTGSWRKFSKALNAAKKVSADTHATQNKVDTVVKSLTAAQNGLKKATSSAKPKESPDESLPKTGASVKAIAITTVLMGLLAGCALIIKRVRR